MSAPSPVDTYLSVYFYEHESVEKIINRFELYNVSDLANLTDSQIDAAQRVLDLSYGETYLLKQLRNAQQDTQTVGSEVGSQSLAPLLAQLRDIWHDGDFVCKMLC